MPSDYGWARSAPARMVREAVIRGVLGPLMDLYSCRRVHGREVFQSLDGPCLLVANHASHMDAPTIMRSLPPEVSRRTVVAAAADYFYANPLLASAVALGIGTVPVQRHGAAEPAASSTLDDLVGERWNLVVFAEGTRSRDGTVGRLHSGAALLAATHGLPIVPVYVTGTHGVMPPGRSWMRRPASGKRARVVVRFGPPIRPGEGEHRTAVMERVRQFFESCGALTVPDKRILAERRRAEEQLAWRGSS